MKTTCMSTDTLTSMLALIVRLAALPRLTCKTDFGGCTGVVFHARGALRVARGLQDSHTCEARCPLVCIPCVICGEDVLSLLFTWAVLYSTYCKWLKLILITDEAGREAGDVVTIQFLVDNELNIPIGTSNKSYNWLLLAKCWIMVDINANNHELFLQD